MNPTRIMRCWRDLAPVGALLAMSIAGACDRGGAGADTIPAANASQAPAASASAGPAASVRARWVPARPPEEASFLELPAVSLLTPEASGMVKPPYAGRITRAFVRAGDRVTRGQPIVEVIMPEVAAAAGSHVAAETRIQAYLGRKKQLDVLRAEGLARQAEVTEVEMALAEAKAEQQRARALLRSAGVDLAGVARLVESGVAVSLRSPIAGTVIEVNAASGDTRDASGPPLARIAGPAPARIEARLSHALPPASRLEFVPLGGAPMPVRQLGIAPVRDPRDGTTLSWFEPEPARDVPAGTTGKLRVRLAARSGLVLVPAAAVSASDGRSYVIKRAGLEGKRVDIQVVTMSGADALVSGELAPGDEVAAEAGAAPASVR